MGGRGSSSGKRVSASRKGGGAGRNAGSVSPPKPAPKKEGKKGTKYVSVRVSAKVHKGIMHVGKGISNFDVEHGVLFDSTGKVKWSGTDNKKHSVRIPGKKTGDIVLHNHPSSSPLSPADINNAARWDTEVRATTRKGYQWVYDPRTMGTIKGDLNATLENKANYRAFRSKMQKAMSKKIAKAGLTNNYNQIERDIYYAWHLKAYREHGVRIKVYHAD